MYYWLMAVAFASLLGGNPPGKPPKPLAVSRHDVERALSTVDVRERIAAKLRGHLGSDFGLGSGIKFPSSYAAANVYITSTDPSFKGDYTWTFTNKQPQQPQVLDFVNWPNWSSGEMSFSKTFSDSYSESYTWTTTQTVSVGASLEVEIGLPGEISATAGVSTEISIGNEESKAQAHERGFSTTVNVVVPANSTTYAALIAYPVSIDATWSRTVVLDGYLSLIGASLAPVMTRMSTILSEAERTFQIGGTFSANVGTNTQPCTEQYASGTPRPGKCP